ncbi:VOC family protein [Rugamonas rivuli]|uniref:VOC family protein n=1 Tax=Rugamonas rivuli TaxID=2743358 RepID=A0A843SCJ5_9BURK|nr:VOC family protein [Rugamonas rivuli]MQA19804.1 VOC family protein [Rugamonas rivuli]
MHSIQKITPFLWFSGRAEEAAEYYVGIFRNSRICQVIRYTEAGQEQHRQPPGSAMTVALKLDGQDFTLLNGGPIFQFTPAISFVVNCESQEEIDYFWERLSAGGAPEARQCGWLADKFGLSWQIVPTALPTMLQDADAEKAGRVMSALMGMKKIDLGELKKAYAGQ